MNWRLGVLVGNWFFTGFIILIALGLVGFAIFEWASIVPNKYYCEEDLDCRAIQKDCDRCSCDYLAVSLDYYNYWNDFCENSKVDVCDLYCEEPSSVRCMSNSCILE